MGTRGPDRRQRHAIWRAALLLLGLFATAHTEGVASEPQAGGTNMVEIEGEAKVGGTTLVEMSADATRQHMYRTPDNRIIITKHSSWPPHPKEEKPQTVDLIPNTGALAEKLFPRFRAVQTATAATATQTNAAVADHASGTAEGDPDVISKHTTRHKTPSGDVIETTTVVRKEIVMEEVSPTSNSGNSGGSNGGSNSGGSNGGSNNSGGGSNGGSNNSGGGSGGNSAPAPPARSSSSAAPASSGPSQQDMQRMEAMRQESMRREMEMRRQEEMQKQQMRSMERDPRTMSAGGMSSQTSSSSAAGQSSVTQTKDDGATIVSRIRLRILQPDDGCCGKGDGGAKKKKDDGDDWKGKLPDYAKVHIRGPQGRVLTVKVGPYQPVGQLASLGSQSDKNSDDDNGDDQDDAPQSSGAGIPGGLQGTAVPVMGIPYYQTGATAAPVEQRKQAQMVSPQIIGSNKDSCSCHKKAPSCPCSEPTPVRSQPNVRRLLLFEKVPQTARAIR